MLSNLKIGKGQFCHNTFDIIDSKNNWEEIVGVNFNTTLVVFLFQRSYP